MPANLPPQYYKAEEEYKSVERDNVLEDGDVIELHI